MNKFIKIISILLISVFLTVISVFYESAYSTVEGNACCIPNCEDDHMISYCDEKPKRSCEFHPECFKDYPKAGFPFAFVYDSPNISVPGVLGFEDYLSLRFNWFLVDIVFYSLFIYLIYFLVKRFYRNKE